MNESGNINTTDYAGGYIYRNGKLEFIRTAEGYAMPSGGGYRYVYEYKDHLGNIRLSYTDANNDGTVTNSEIIEENNYYPFGLKIKDNVSSNFSLGNDLARQYKYNGKELNEELGLNWYDYGARNYQADLGRWFNVDPMAEEYYSYSSYNYTLNNPICFIDPNGMYVDNYGIDEKGNISLLENTNDDYDVLYSVDNKGKKRDTDGDGKINEKDGVRIKDKTILPELKVVGELKIAKELKISQATRNAEGYDILNIFKFASDNSNVEWSLDLYNSGNGKKYTISTFYNENYSPGHESLGISTESMISSWHSHPDIDIESERSSMGDLKANRATVGTSDWQKTINNYNKYGREMYRNNVYFPISGNIYHIKPWKIKKLN